MTDEERAHDDFLLELAQDMISILEKAFEAGLMKGLGMQVQAKAREI